MLFTIVRRVASGLLGALRVLLCGFFAASLRLLLASLRLLLAYYKQSPNIIFYYNMDKKNKSILAGS
jgi:hypothetical protein